jgi:signal transduction histidine kinase
MVKHIAAELQLRWQDIRFELHVPHLAQGVEVPLVTVSRSGLQEVFEILACNSDRHGRQTPTHPLKVDIEMEYRPAAVRVLFRDNGVGVTSIDRDRLFTPFFTTSAQGTGLGLAIARNLMRRMHGNLRIADNDNSGATFCLEFSFATAHSTNPWRSGEDHV